MSENYPYFHPCTASKFEKQSEWMYATYGKIGVRWDYWRTTFWFKDERDYTLFLLRWT